jgi:hypothetical protein
MNSGPATDSFELAQPTLGLPMAHWALIDLCLTHRLCLRRARKANAQKVLGCAV